MADQKTLYRLIYHRICCLELPPEQLSLCSGFPGRETAQAVLAYCYVDHEAGLSFEVLSCARFEDGKLIASPGSPELSLKLRMGSLSPDCGISLFDSPEVRARYGSQLRTVDEAYSGSEELEALREETALDPFRSPEYPDDLLVNLIRGDTHPEACWVRCESFDPRGGLLGILLNEPYADFGVHAGELLPFGLAGVDGKTHCVCFCPPDGPE